MPELLPVATTLFIKLSTYCYDHFEGDNYYQILSGPLVIKVSEI